MSTYTVRSGENIFDVAMNIYGGIEGIFDLLVQNMDAETHTGLSITDTLKPGMVLRYTDGFRVNDGIVGWMSKNGVVSKGGEFSYGHFAPASYIFIFAKRHNVAVCKHAIATYGVLESELSRDSIRNNIVLNGSVPDFGAIENGDYTSVIDIRVSDQYKRPSYVVKQTGIVSLVDAECECIVIDWGDNTWPSIYFGGTGGTVEHCYEDGGTHIIRIYASKRGRINLDNIGGVAYQTSEYAINKYH